MTLRTSFPAPRSAPDKEEQKQDGWRNLGIAVINVNDPRLLWEEREQLRSLANKLLGWGRHSRPKISTSSPMPQRPLRPEDVFRKT